MIVMDIYQSEFCEQHAAYSAVDEWFLKALSTL